MKVQKNFTKDGPRMSYQRFIEYERHKRVRKNIKEPKINYKRGKAALEKGSLSALSFHIEAGKCGAFSKCLPTTW